MKSREYRLLQQQVMTSVRRRGNGCIYRDYEYKRLGTMSLIAGIDLLTGIAIPVVKWKLTKVPISSVFWRNLMKCIRKRDVIRIICDNHSAHKSKEVQNYLATKPEGRYVFVFTPKHASWLNPDWMFLPAKWQNRCWKEYESNQSRNWRTRIYQYFDEINKEPVYFHWTYKLDEISEEEANPNMAKLIYYSIY